MKIQWEESNYPKDSVELIDRVYDGLHQPAYMLYYEAATGYFYKVEHGNPTPISKPRWFRSTENLNW